MKKAFMALALLTLLVLPCALAEEEVFYVLEYDGNGGHCGIEPQVIYPGQTITLSNSWCSWEDHVFLGWATTPDAETAEYQPKDSFTVNEDTTLYAVWVECYDLGVIDPAKTYTISYPIEKGFAYLLFEVPEDGYYYIHSLGKYLSSGYGTTWLEPVDNEFDTTYPDTSDDDYSFVVELTAGRTYRIMYYHVTDPLPIVFQPQYEGKNYVSGIQLESVLFYGMDTRIAPDAFAGCKDLVIIAPVGSTAQAFAEQMGWDFLELK